MIHHWRLFKNPRSLKLYGCNFIGLLVSPRCRGSKQPGNTWLGKPHLQHIHGLWQYSQCFPISVYVLIHEEPGSYISSKQLWLLSAHRRSLFNLCGKHAMIFQTSWQSRCVCLRHKADVQSQDVLLVSMNNDCEEKLSIVLYITATQNNYKYTIL